MGNGAAFRAAFYRNLVHSMPGRGSASIITSSDRYSGSPHPSKPPNRAPASRMMNHTITITIDAIVNFRAALCLMYGSKRHFHIDRQ